MTGANTTPAVPKSEVPDAASQRVLEKEERHRRKAERKEERRLRKEARQAQRHARGRSDSDDGDSRRDFEYRRYRDRTRSRSPQPRRTSRERERAQEQRYPRDRSLIRLYGKEQDNGEDYGERGREHEWESEQRRRDSSRRELSDGRQRRRR